MSCGKCKKSMSLCPISLGLAFGVTASVAGLLWAAWAKFYGAPPAVANYMSSIYWSEIAMRAFWTLLKGFFFGFFIALIYDLIIRCCPGKCCKRAEGDSECGCSK